MTSRRVLAASCLLLASCGGAGASAPVDPLPDDPPVSRACRDDLGILDAKDCRSVAALLLPESLPPARGNAVADSLPAAQLGFQLFFDPRFSAVPAMRCATCHLPEKSFDDGRQVSLGKDDVPLPRNSPSIFTAAWNPTDFFWDGRADSLWSQPLFALENPMEMATTRLAIAHTVADNSFYRPLYEAAFGPVPDLSDATRFPASGKPGDASFDSMAPADQDVINRFAANFGKALEAYMRKVATGRSPLDRYLLGVSGALGEASRRGLSVFVKARCVDCHGGPTLSDGLYHDMNVPPLPGAPKDPGRGAGLAILAANPFNAQGPYFDQTAGVALPPPPAATPADDGAFRTPSLRNVALTGPYGHNGYYPTLEALLASHGNTKLTEQQIASLGTFFLDLGGAYPQRPWSNWPTN